jgi:hypothetical protein
MMMKSPVAILLVLAEYFASAAFFSIHVIAPCFHADRVDVAATHRTYPALSLTCAVPVEHALHLPFSTFP